MNAARVTARHYVDFLIATPKVASACEAARIPSSAGLRPAHDAFSRLLDRLEPDPTELWREVAPLIRPAEGILIIDDSVLDKPYARKMPLVGRFWSGKHKRVVKGINLVTLAWSDGDAVFPVDYRLVEKTQTPAQNKYDFFRQMLATAKARGFAPRYVCFDSWYSGKDNLKAVRAHGWHFLTQVRSNRRVDPDRTGNRSISETPISSTGTVVHVEGFGLVKAFRIVAKDGSTGHWITDDLDMDELTRVDYAQQSWAIEDYHRGLKQFTGVERCSARKTRSQRNHIGLALRAFLRLEWHRFQTGVSWFEAKWDIVRKAVGAYVDDPRFNLPEPATA